MLDAIKKNMELKIPNRSGVKNDFFYLRDLCQECNIDTHSIMDMLKRFEKEEIIISAEDPVSEYG